MGVMGAAGCDGDLFFAGTSLLFVSVSDVKTAGGSLYSRVADSPAADCTVTCMHTYMQLSVLCCAADEAVLVTDYTQEPKYAAEVPQQLPGPAERSTDAAAAPAGAEDGEGGGVPLGSGQPQVLVVGQGAGAAAAGAGGGKQQQKQGDARHLDAIFAPPDHRL
jgi:hypothetical protein